MEVIRIGEELAWKASTHKRVRGSNPRTSAMMTSEELKEIIQKYVDKQKWDDYDISVVKNIVSNIPKISIQTEVNDVEKLREALLSILIDFDISISKNKIIFQPIQKGNWWHSNYPWVLATIGAVISTITGIITIVKAMQNW